MTRLLLLSLCIHRNKCQMLVVYDQSHHKKEQKHDLWGTFSFLFRYGPMIGRRTIMKRFQWLIPLLAILLCTVSYAHSGRTDANGGHYNRSTGEYHYHHGYSAHQHPGGVCPYDTPVVTPPAENIEPDDTDSTPVSDFLKERAEQAEQESKERVAAQMAATTERLEAEQKEKNTVYIVGGVVIVIGLAGFAYYRHKHK